MEKTRESNYDLLRICSAFAVIVLHVSGSFLVYNEAEIPTNCIFSVMLINHVVRFAVPSFFMLSGAFILADERNVDYRYFYRKAAKNVGVTGIIFCLLYEIYRAIKMMLNIFVMHKRGTDALFPGLFSLFKDFLSGHPYSHLWYLYTLIGLYFAAPFIIRLAIDLRGGGINLYGGITIVFLGLASVSYITSEHELQWDIGWQFCFLSYFLMGYKLRQWGKSRKNNRTAVLLISAGIAVNVVLACINYLRGLKGLPVDVIQYCKNPFSYAPLAPIEVVASCLIFSGFATLKLRRDFSNLSGYTFLIYLVHAGVIDVLLAILRDRLIGDQVVETISVIFISLGVFIVSVLFAIIYKKILAFIMFGILKIGA